MTIKPEVLAAMGKLRSLSKRDGVSEANRECVEIIRAELLAMDARLALALKDALTEREIQNAADKLPPDYTITLYIESGSGYIDLTDPDGDPIHVDTDDMRMAEQIAEATKTAAMHNSARELGNE